MTEAMNSLELVQDEIDTPLGKLTLVVDDQGRLRLLGWHEGHARMGRGLQAYGSGKGALQRVDNPHGASAALRAYFDGQLDAIDSLPVYGEGTEFQRRVWHALREIPCGETWSYSQLARHIGKPAAVRAVGLANGANPIGIVVPCHRVIGADGTLTGYGGGLERKRWLLQHESAQSALDLSAPDRLAPDISAPRTGRASRPAAAVRA